MNPFGPLVSLVRRLLQADFWINLDRHKDQPAPSFASISTGDSDVQRQRDGYGPLTRRQYSITIANPKVNSDELLDRFRRDPNCFSPTSIAEFDPTPGEDGMQVGDDYIVKVFGPWSGPVRVQLADRCKVRFVTLDGHMEAGWIEFTTADANAGIMIFRIESAARSGDQVFDRLYHRLGIGKLIQSDMWVNVLESAVKVSGGRQVGRARIETVIHHDRDIGEPAQI